MKQWGPPLALFALAVLLLFTGLGELGLTDRDEGSNAEAAREMLESGNWVYPTLNGEPRFAKPVLIYWLTASGYLAFGVDEFTARLPSAVFGVGLIILQYAFLSRLRGSFVGLLGALILLLNIEIVAIGRLALTDSVLMFFTTLALFGFWLGLHEPHGRRFFWLFYVGMALGTLTKGPIGFLVPLIVVVPYLTVTRRWSQFWRMGFPVTGTLVFLFLAVPWYAVMLWIHGSRYTTSAQADTVGRFFSIIGGHGGTIFFYMPVLLFGFFPWSAFLPVALYQVLKEWREFRRASQGPARTSPSGWRTAGAQELELFAALWLVGGFLFFSLSATRLPHYIGPLYPAAAILVASYWKRAITEPMSAGINLSFKLLLGLGYLLGFVLILSRFLYYHYIDQVAKEFPVAAQVDPGGGLVIAGLILLVGAGVSAYFGLSPERRAGAFWAAGVTIGLVLLVAVEWVLPRFSRYFIDPPHELAYVAGLNLAPEERLIVYGPPKPSVLFYAKRRAILIKPGEEDLMKPFLHGEGRTMILLPSRMKSRLPVEAAGFLPVLERYGYSLLANQPMVTLPPAPPRPPDPHGF